MFSFAPLAVSPPSPSLLGTLQLRANGFVDELRIRQHTYFFFLCMSIRPKSTDDFGQQRPHPQGHAHICIYASTHCFSAAGEEGGMWAGSDVTKPSLTVPPPSPAIAVVTPLACSPLCYISM